MTRRISPFPVSSRVGDTPRTDDKSVAPCETAGKDRLLAELHDLTGDRAAAVALTIWQAGEAQDFVQHAIGTIHPLHHGASRGRAIAALVSRDPRTGERINKGEAHHATTWPLHLAGLLPFLTLRGAVAYVVDATGMDAAQADAMIRSALGPARDSQT